MDGILEATPPTTVTYQTVVDRPSYVGVTPRQANHHHSMLPGLIKAYDVASAISAAALVSIATYYELGVRDSRFTLVAGILATCAFLLLLSWELPYDLHHLQGRKSRPGTVILPLCGGAAANLLVTWLLPTSGLHQFVPALAWLLLTQTLLTAGHAMLRLVLRRPAFARHLTSRMAIVGSGDMAQRVAGRLNDKAVASIVGFFDCDQDGMQARRKADPHASVEVACGSIDDLIATSRNEEIDGVIIALPPEREHEVGEICLKLRSVLTDIYVVPNLLHGYDFEVPLAKIGPLTLAIVQRRPLTQWERVQKSTFDRIVGAVLLATVLPLLLLIAVLIKIDSPGPVFFRQPRLGFNNRSFTVFKFRSMHTNMTDMMADRQTSRHDPRVTRLGKWLRRLSLDELPQLLNVLRGEMSIVGPRPHAPNTRAGGRLLGDALAEYVIRHQVKPGITGWAQVNGARGELQDIEQLRRRVTLDLEYMQRWSLGFDVRIMLLTVMREIVSRHAF